MKRFIAISLLFCANLIILAHNVLPHHHHNGMAVSLQLLDRHDHDTRHEHHHHHDADHHESHNHQNESNSENCLLSNLLSRLVINDKDENSGFEADAQLVSWLAILPNFSDHKIVIEGDWIGHRPYVLLKHSLPDVFSNGLRAPPIC